MITNSKNYRFNLTIFLFTFSLVFSLLWARVQISNAHLIQTNQNASVFLCFSNFCRPLQCSQCPASFVEKGKLRLHLKVHTKPDAYICHLCDRSFSRKNDLKKHVRTHLQIRQFHCAHCSKTFLTNEGLRNHVGVHTGERPYKCGLCPMASKFSASCSLHRRKHLNAVGMYECERCAHQTKSFTNLKMHLAACMPGRLIL